MRNVFCCRFLFAFSVVISHVGSTPLGYFSGRWMDAVDRGKNSFNSVGAGDSRGSQPCAAVLMSRAIHQPTRSFWPHSCPLGVGSFCAPSSSGDRPRNELLCSAHGRVRGHRAVPGPDGALHHRSYSQHSFVLGVFFIY